MCARVCAFMYVYARNARGRSQVSCTIPPCLSFETGSPNETGTLLVASKSRDPPVSALPALALAMPAFSIGAGVKSVSHVCIANALI